MLCSKLEPRVEPKDGTSGSAPRRQWRVPTRCTARRAMSVMVAVLPSPSDAAGSWWMLASIIGSANWPAPPSDSARQHDERPRRNIVQTTNGVNV